MKLRALIAASGLLALSVPALADDALMKALKERDGKTATVVLVSGAELTGKVSDVGSESVKLSELSGKEYFDAMIDLDHVQAVVYRARDK